VGEPVLFICLQRNDERTGVSNDLFPDDIVDRMLNGPAARYVAWRRIDTGQIVFGADEDGVDGLLFVRSGSLRSFVSKAGRELTLFVFGPGDAVRINADTLLDARRKSEIAFIPMSAFREICRCDPEFVTWAILIFDRLLDRSVQLVEDMAFCDVKQRLIRALCDVADREGRDDELGIVIAPPPNADDFATQIGSTRQSVSTVMAELIRGGILHRLGQQSMVISDIGRLRRELASGRRGATRSGADGMRAWEA
jgi:CRP-like cAMP-binding protein